MKKKKVFMDTEFTGLYKNADLISIGMVAVNENTKMWEAMYHNFTDYDMDKCDEWVEDNVIKNLMTRNQLLDLDRKGLSINFYYSKGPKKVFADNFITWAKGTLFGPECDSLMMVSDCSAYDKVLFDNVFGGAFSIPDFVSPVFYDTVHDIYSHHGGDWDYAFDCSREKLVEKLFSEYRSHMDDNGLDDTLIDDLKKIQDALGENMKHNSLYDAIVIGLISIMLGLYEER